MGGRLAFMLARRVRVGKVCTARGRIALDVQGIGLESLVLGHDGSEVMRVGLLRCRESGRNCRPLCCQTSVVGLIEQDRGGGGGGLGIADQAGQASYLA